MRHKAKMFAMAGVAMILLLAGAGVRAQDAASAPPPPPPPGHGFGHGPGRDEIRFLGFEAGLGDKTVTGAPFSATFSTESTETLGDGNQIKHTSTGTIARDSQGRTRRDMTLPAFGATAAAGQAAPHVTFVNDPVAGTHTVLDPSTKTARQMSGHMHGGKGAPDARGERREKADAANVTKEQLGTQTIEGVVATGTRITRTIPAGEIGNDKPLQIVTERWFSNDLQVVVKSTHTDPRWGTSTYQLTNISRTEPAASLFQVPADYTVKQGEGGGRHRGFGGPPPAGAPAAPQE